MLLFSILWVLYSNTVLAASLLQRSESVGSPDTRPIPNLNLLSPTLPAPSSNHSASGNRLQIACNAKKFGKNLKVSSCRNVLGYMSKNETQYTFAERDSGVPFDVPLPWRTLSNDGLCFVQPVLKEGAVSGRASGTEIGEAAATMLQACVVERGMGGIAFNIGGDNNINVVITDYKPNVKCDPTSTPGPPWNSTVALFATMRASKQLRVFGSPREPDVEERLPLALIAGDEKSELTISIEGPATFATWYEIWEGASAIAMMCSRQKEKGGKARGFGLDKNIHLELSTLTDGSGGTVGNASTVLAAGNGIAPLQEFAAASSLAAGSMGFDWDSRPFELLPGLLVDNSSETTLPDDSEE